MSIPGAASPLFIGAAAAAEAGYQIDRSLRFSEGDQAYLNRTPSSAGNRKTYTLSFWVKKSKISDEMFIFAAKSGGGRDGFRFEPGNTFRVFFDSANDGDLVTSQVFTDPSAWYHFVIAVDTTQSTAANRVKIYVNGAQIEDFSTETYPAQNYTGEVNNTDLHRIGADTNNLSNTLEGYLAEIHLVDGQQLAASDFGEYDDNNVWQPKEFTGSYNAASTGSGIVYSSGVSSPDGTIAASPNDATALFDGGTSTNCQTTTAGTTVRWTPPTTTTWSSSLRVNTGAYSGSVVVRSGGTNYTLNSNGTQVASPYWLSHPNSSGTIEYIEAQGHIGAGVGYMKAIEIDGTILQDGTPAGVNGFYLDFSDNSSNAALGTDSSGLSNTWTVNNLSAAYNFGLTNAAQIVGTSKTFSFPITYTATLTYEFFVRITTDGTYNYMAKMTGDQWNLGTSGSSLLFGNYNGGWTTFSNTGLNDAAWHFVRLTTTGSSTSLYVDGSLIATNSSGGSVSTGSQVTNQIRGTGSGAFEIAHLRITTGGTPPTTGVPNISDMNAAAGSGGTLVFYDKLDDIASSGTKTSDGGNVTITMSAATVGVTDSNADSLIDTPTNYTAASGNNGGNYATWNPLQKYAAITLSNGNLDFTDSNSVNGGDQGVHATIAPLSGKFYWEMTLSTLASENYIGISKSDKLTQTLWTGGGVDGYYYYQNGKKIGGGNGNGGVSYGASFGVGDVIGVAVDWDNGKVTFYKNGSSQGDAFTGKDLTGYVPAYYFNTNQSSAGSVNFGARPFAYTPPTGYVSLCTQNLADPTIADGSTAFNIKTWTGTGSSHAITGYGFSPDFAWIKSRNNTASHAWVDTVRGNSNVLRSDNTTAEVTGNTSVWTSFDTDGFTLGADNNNGWTNYNNWTYVGWAWDAGTTTASNTDGSITTNVRASQTNGFSIATYTGNGSANQTLGHGLGAAPAFVIIKDRTSSQNWAVLHTSAGTLGTLDGGTNYALLELNATAAARNASYNTIWHPTNTTVKIGEGASSAHWTNKSGDDYVMYSWTPISQFSAFGSFEGNGNADGPFVGLSFQPALIIIKNVDNYGTGYDWFIFDTARDTFNVGENTLKANLGAAETDSDSIDILSNGFKIRTTANGLNLNAHTHIYCAWAEHPFKTARAR